MDKKKTFYDNIEGLLKDQKITFSKSKDEIWDDFFKNKISPDSHQSATTDKNLIKIVKLNPFKYVIAASIILLLGVVMFSRYFNYSKGTDINNSQYNTIENSVLLESFLIDDEEVSEHFNRYVINQLVDD